MIHRIKLRRDERGSATIEMAIVAPVLAVVIMGIVDLSTAYSRKLEIEQGAQRAIEKVMQTTTDDTVDNTLAAEAAAAAKVPEGQVTVSYLLECDDGSNVTTTDISSVVASVAAQRAAGTAEADIDLSGMSCASGSSQAQYLTVEITETFTPLFDPRYIGIDSSSFDITVETGIRTQ